MTVYFQIASDRVTVVNPLHIVDGSIVVESHPCFADVWDKSARRAETGRITMLIDVPKDFLITYVEWLRDIGFDARVVHGECVRKRIRSSWNDSELSEELQDGMFIELAWKSSDPQTKIFVGLNLARFITSEFIQYLPNREYIEYISVYFSSLFSSDIIVNSNHFPAAQRYRSVVYPSRDLGKRIYQFYSDYCINNRWKNTHYTMGTHTSHMCSDIDHSELIAYEVK